VETALQWQNLTRSTSAAISIQENIQKNRLEIISFSPHMDLNECVRRVYNEQCHHQKARVSREPTGRVARSPHTTTMMLKQSSRKVFQLRRSISTSSVAPGFVPEGKERYSSQSDPETKLFINGEFVKSSATKFFEVLNPVRTRGLDMCGELTRARRRKKLLHVCLNLHKRKWKLPSELPRKHSKIGENRAS
jgi:hypothetical protein